MPNLLHKIIRFDELASTNTKCMELLRQGEIPPYSVIITGKQTNGKGQNGNKWHSDEGLNLTFSLYVPHEKLPAENQFYLNKAISLGLRNAIHELVLLPTHIKWPNDIYIENEKVAGILIENQLQGSTITNSVVGIGINVNQVSFDSDYGNPTSLYLHTGIKLDLNEVLDGVLKQLMLTLNQLKMRQFEDIQVTYDSHLYKKGELCYLEGPEGVFAGTIVRVNNLGDLVYSNSKGVQVKSHGTIKIKTNETLY